MIAGYGFRSWQVRLGSYQVTALLGLMMGSIFSSYFLGFHSGKGVGLENALTITAGQVVKFRIAAAPVEDKTQNTVTNEAINSFEIDTAKPAVHENINQKDKSSNDAKESTVELATLPTTKIDEPLQDVLPVKEVNNSVTEDIKKSDTLKKEVKLPLSDSPEINVQPDTVIKKTSSVTQTLTESKPVEKLEISAVEKNKAEKNKIANDAQGEKWYAQVSAPNTLSEANALQKQLRNSGFNVTISKVQVGKNQVFRVLVGPEKNKEIATRMINQLKREKFIKSTPFLKKGL